MADVIYCTECDRPLVDGVQRRCARCGLLFCTEHCRLLADGRLLCDDCIELEPRPVCASPTLLGRVQP